MKLSIISIRPMDDPFFFPEITVKVKARRSLPAKVEKQEELLVKIFEGLLNVIILALMVGCMVSQVVHLWRRRSSMLYISPLMLLVMGAGFSMTLLTNMHLASTWFHELEPEGDTIDALILKDMMPWATMLRTHRLWAKPIGYMVRGLALAALLLTVEIAMAVCSERVLHGATTEQQANVISRSKPSKGFTITSEHKRAVILFVTHGIGFLTVFLFMKRCAHHVVINGWPSH